jgi:hypothetical protein
MRLACLSPKARGWSALVQSLREVLMIRTSYVKRLSVVLALAAVGALVAAGSASATHPAVGLSPSLNGYLVPVYKQCGPAGTYGTPGSTHSTPLAVPACGAIPAGAQTAPGPALADSSSGAGVNAVGPALAGAPAPLTDHPVWPFEIRYTNMEAGGSGSPCYNGSAGGATGDVCLYAALHSVAQYATADPPYVPAASVPFAGALAVVARIRFTDHYNCTPTGGCPPGSFDQPGTGADLDFGPIPFACSAAGTCNLSLTANAATPGAVVSGIDTNIQIFRVRVIIPANPSAQQLMAQQGIGWNNPTDGP